MTGYSIPVRQGVPALSDTYILIRPSRPRYFRFRESLRQYIGVKNTQLYIAVTNAAGRKREKAGGLFRSSKGSRHGFGMTRVEAIVKKYDGIFTADSEDGGFTAEVLIPTS